MRNLGPKELKCTSRVRTLSLFYSLILTPILNYHTYAKQKAVCTIYSFVEKNGGRLELNSSTKLKRTAQKIEFDVGFKRECLRESRKWLQTF